MKSQPNHIIVAVSVALVLIGVLFAATYAMPASFGAHESVVAEVAGEISAQQATTATVAPTVAPTKATTTTTAAAAPSPTPVPVNAVVSIVPVAANAAKDPNVLTATISYISDTVMGPYSLTVAMGATGLNNVPINVPVHVQCVSDDSKNPGKPAWSLIKPTASKASLMYTNTKVTEFTPDVAGWYAATCSLGGGGEVGGVRVQTGAYVGMTDGKCATCHPGKATEWAKTGHAKIFTEQIDTKPTHYTPNCSSCHTTGWYADKYGQGAGGFWEAATKANWVFPTWKQIEAGGNWDKAPAAVKNMANIQCEQCHGPAADHVKSDAPMATSMDEGVCNVCHNGSSRHDKGEQLKNAAHSNKDAAAFNVPVGPGEQACVRCHSGKGYASFLENPDNPAAWDNTKQTIVCATCHDPHSDANTFQLRVNNKPIGLPFELQKDVGLSATCFECHNSRANPKDAIKSSFPHYSSVAEFLSDTGGVTYTQNIPNSPHGTMVGAAPIPNPAWTEGSDVSKFLFTTADGGKETGNTPGPCVTCHMWPGITDGKDPNYEKVGGHSFNTVSPDGKTDYGAACKNCHGDVKDFNLKAKADYDGNGQIEGVQDEVKGLLGQVWKCLESKGVKKQDSGYPYATLPKDAQGNTDDKIDNAWYNYRTVYGVMWGTGEDGKPTPGNEGKAQSIHNFKRAVSLLQTSYKDLCDQDVPGATVMK